MLVNGSTIGVTAMSAGVGKKLDEYELSIQQIKENGFNIIETNNVRVNNYVSTSLFKINSSNSSARTLPDDDT